MSVDYELKSIFDRVIDTHPEDLIKLCFFDHDDLLERYAEGGRLEEVREVTSIAEQIAKKYALVAIGNLSVGVVGVLDKAQRVSLQRGRS